MWIEAVLLKEELSILVGQFAPVTLRLGEDAELQIRETGEVTIVPELGLRVICKATLRRSVLGFDVPVVLDSLAVLLRPEIAKRGDVNVLVFGLELEQADIAGLPSGIDRRITDFVNRELGAVHVELSWDYAATLNHLFDLPDILKPVERLQVTVGGARVKTSGESLALAIEFYADVVRGLPLAAQPASLTGHGAPSGPARANGELVYAKPRRKSVAARGPAASARSGPQGLGRARI
jgi:hypothetical protein